MKKIIFLTISLSFLYLFGFSQINDNSVGVRLNGGLYFGGEVSYERESYLGGEVSYQKKLSERNRVEIDLGFSLSSTTNNALGQVVAIYHWVFSINNGFNWYIGPGANLGILQYANYSFSSPGYQSQYPAYVDFGFGGQIGIEYDFNIHDKPFVISLDTRPMIQIMPLFNNGDGDFCFWGAAISGRYTF